MKNCQMHFLKRMIMLSGKSKGRLRLIAFILVLGYTSCYDRTKQMSMEDQYNKLVTLGNKDSLQVKFISNLKKLGLKDGESKQVKIKHLLGFDFKKLYLIDKMVIDFSVPCNELQGTSELSNKEFCQFGIIYKKDGTIEYLRGICDYDLMGLSHSFDKTGFSVKNPIEVVFPEDSVVISYSTQDRVLYLMEPVSHKKIDMPRCH